MPAFLQICYFGTYLLFTETYQKHMLGTTCHSLLPSSSIPMHVCSHACNVLFLQIAKCHQLSPLLPVSLPPSTQTPLSFLVSAKETNSITTIITKIPQQEMGQRVGRGKRREGGREGREPWAGTYFYPNTTSNFPATIMAIHSTPTMIDKEALNNSNRYSIFLAEPKRDVHSP